MGTKSATASAASSYPEGGKSRKRGGPGLFTDRESEEALEIWLDASLPKRGELLSLIEGEGGEIKPDHGSPDIQLIILSPRSVNVFDSYCHPSWLPPALRARKERQRAALREAAENVPSSSKATNVVVGDDEDIWKRKVLLKEGWVRACVAAKKFYVRLVFTKDNEAVANGKGEKEDWGGFRAGGPPRTSPVQPPIQRLKQSHPINDTAVEASSQRQETAKDARHSSDSPQPSESDLMEVEALASKLPPPIPPVEPETPTEPAVGPEPITVEEAYVDIYPTTSPVAASNNLGNGGDGDVPRKKKRKRPSIESSTASGTGSSNGESSTKRNRTDGAGEEKGKGPGLKTTDLCKILREETNREGVPTAFGLHAEYLAAKYPRISPKGWKSILQDWEYKTGQFSKVDAAGFSRQEQEEKRKQAGKASLHAGTEPPLTQPPPASSTMAPRATAPPANQQPSLPSTPALPTPRAPSMRASVDLTRSPESKTAALTAEELEAKKARTTEKIRRVLVREVEKWAPKEIDSAFFAHLGEAYDKYSAKRWHKYYHEWTTSTGKFSGAGPSRRDSSTTTVTADADARESPAIAGPSRPTSLPDLGTQPSASSQSTPKKSQSQTTPRKHHSIPMEAQPLFMAPIITQPSPVKRSSTAASDRTSPSAKTKVAPALTSKALVEIFEAAVRDHPDDDAEEISKGLLAEHGTLSSGFSWKTYFEDWQHKRNRFAFLAGNGKGAATLSPVQQAPLVNLEPSQGTSSHHSEKLPVEQLDRIFQSQQPLLDAGQSVASIIRSLVSSYGQYAQQHWDTLYRDWRNKSGRFAPRASTAPRSTGEPPLAADGSSTAGADEPNRSVRGFGPRMTPEERDAVILQVHEQDPTVTNPELARRLAEQYGTYTVSTWGNFVGEFRKTHPRVIIQRQTARLPFDERADILQTFNAQYPELTSSEVGKLIADEYPEYTPATWCTLMGEFRRAISADPTARPVIGPLSRMSIEEKADILQRFNEQYSESSNIEVGRRIAEEHPEYAAGTWGVMMGEFRRAQLDGATAEISTPDAFGSTAGSPTGGEHAAGGGRRVGTRGPAYSSDEDLAMAAYVFGRLPTPTLSRYADWEDFQREMSRSASNAQAADKAHPPRSVAAYTEHYRKQKTQIDDLVRQMGGVIPDVALTQRYRDDSEDSVVYVDPPESDEEHEVIEVLSDSDLDL